MQQKWTLSCYWNNALFHFLRINLELHPYSMDNRRGELRMSLNKGPGRNWNCPGIVQINIPILSPVWKVAKNFLEFKKSRRCKIYCFFYLFILELLSSLFSTFWSAFKIMFHYKAEEWNITYSMKFSILRSKISLYVNKKHGFFHLLKW